jgi:hypothetical protein
MASDSEPKKFVGPAKIGLLGGPSLLLGVQAPVIRALPLINYY